ncbi:MAG: GNAT family N-acetyltransferase [Bryobacteraceae bacterium]
MPATEVSAVANNLLRAMRFFGSARSTGEIRDIPGVCLISCGLNYAAFNAALLSEPLSADVNELRTRIQAPAHHFCSRNLRWTYWLCDDYLHPSLRRESRSLFNSLGLATLTEPPGMFAERLLPPKRRLPDLVVRPVADEPTRRAFAHITSVAFEIPQTICRDIYGSSLAWEGDFHGFVGYVDNLPVATAATIVTAGVAGVYSVGTLPHCRKRGYAEALMRHALSMEREKSGIEATVLQATQSGLRMYEQMGYSKITKFSVYIS